MFDEVEARLARLNVHRPFDEGMMARLDAVFEPWFIYGSNALEGNTLTLGDTIYLIREGRLPGGKREEEYLEVKGQQAAYSYLQQAVVGKFPLSEKLIREFHQLLTERLDPEKYLSGRYKDRDNQVCLPDGTLFPYVSQLAAPAAMRDLIVWFHGDAQRLHPVERAATLHYRFILIHPFLDGNGRTARLLTNLALLQSGHVMAVFRPEERKRIYIDALHAVDTSVPVENLAPDSPSLNLFPFVSYLEQELLWSYDRALDVVEGRIAITTEDLVRRFAGLEQRGLAAAGIATGETSRMEQASTLVERLTSIVRTKVDEIANVGEKWTELVTVCGDQMDGARDVFEGAPQTIGAEYAARKDLLGIDSGTVRGTVGVVLFRIERKVGSLLQLDLPPNVCEFVIYAEPHALTLASLRIRPDPTGMRIHLKPLWDTSSIRLPLDPQLWRASEIEQFVVEQIGGFLQTTEAEIRERNAQGGA